MAGSLALQEMTKTGAGGAVVRLAAPARRPRRRAQGGGRVQRELLGRALVISLGLG